MSSYLCRIANVIAEVLADLRAGYVVCSNEVIMAWCSIYRAWTIGDRYPLGSNEIVLSLPPGPMVLICTWTFWSLQIKTHSLQKEKEILEDSIQNYKKERKVVQRNILMLPEEESEYVIRSTEDIRLLKRSLLRLVQVTTTYLGQEELRNSDWWTLIVRLGSDDYDFLSIWPTSRSLGQMVINFWP